MIPKAFRWRRPGNVAIGRTTVQSADTKATCAEAKALEGDRRHLESLTCVKFCDGQIAYK